jgi:hypothetical protein
MSDDAEATKSAGPTLAHEGEFTAFVKNHFNPADYLELNVDVAQANVDALGHWLTHGIGEGRQISRSMLVRYGKLARRSSNRNWKHYRWHGEDIAVRVADPIPAAVMEQILSQARHDVALRAACANPIERSGDRESPGHLDVVGLRRAVSHGTEFLLIVPDLKPDSDQRLAADIVSALGDAGLQSIRTIVVNQDSGERGAIPEPFLATEVLFWQDFLPRGPALVGLAQLIRVLRPRATIVVDSGTGRELINRFGPALAVETDLYCLRAAAVQDTGLAEPTQASFAPFRMTSIDDATQAARLWAQYGDHAAHRVRTRPRPDPAAPQATREGRLSAGADPKTGPDVTVTVNFHREGELAVPALASLKDLVNAACAAGLSVETQAILDRTDQVTRHLIGVHGRWLDTVEEVSFGDLGLSRNAGVNHAHGRFLAFLDGDDLWGERWLSAAFAAATASARTQEVVWHPEHLLIFRQAEFDRMPDSCTAFHSVMQSSDTPEFDPLFLIFHNFYSANAFAARDLYLRFPYRAIDRRRGVGIDDWSWNLETLWAGVQHCVVPGAVHLIRKRPLSLDRQNAAAHLLPHLPDGLVWGRKWS